MPQNSQSAPSEGRLNGKKTSGDVLPLIDWRFLEGFTSGDGATKARFLSLFRSQIRIDFDGLAAANTFEEWRTARHALKSTASGIGAMRLVAAITNSGDTSFPTERTNMLFEIGELIDRTIEITDCSKPPIN